MVLFHASGHARLVSFCGARKFVFVCLAVAAALTILASKSAQATGARHQAPCLWGASSVSAEEVDGKTVVSPVTTSGCIPK